jgi:hypothetical protein
MTIHSNILNTAAANHLCSFTVRPAIIGHGRPSKMSLVSTSAQLPTAGAITGQTNKSLREPTTRCPSMFMTWKRCSACSVPRQRTSSGIHTVLLYVCCSPFRRLTTRTIRQFQVLRNLAELLQRGLQVLDDFQGQHVRVRQVGRILQALVAQPEDVQVDLSMNGRGNWYPPGDLPALIAHERSQLANGERPESPPGGGI